MTTTLDDILADTTAESTEIDALATLAAGIKTQLDEALNGQTISPAAQAKVDKIFANIEANKAALSAAILANTASGPAGVPVAAGTPVTTTVDAPPAPAEASSPPPPTDVVAPPANP